MPLFLHPEFLLSGLGGTALALFGTIAILLSSIVLLRIKTPFAYSLLGLSVFDFFFLISGFFAYALPVLQDAANLIKREQQNKQYLQWMENFNDFSQTCSIYFTISISIERCLSQYYPFSVKLWITKKSVWVVWIGVICFSSLFQLIKLINFPAIGQETVRGCGNWTEGVVNFNYVDYYVQWPYVLFMIGLPFVLLAVVNALVFFKMKSNAKLREKITLHQTDSGNTMILLGIVAVFLICQLGCIAVIICRYFRVCTYLRFMSELYAVDMLLLDANCAVNFFIYFIYGEQFRKELGVVWGMMVWIINKK